MKVKELIKSLEKYDQEKDILIRFAVSEKDELGYILEPCIVADYIGTPAIYAECTATKEDCDVMGQFDLTTLWENEYKERYEQQ